MLESKLKGKTKVVGIGSALIDILASESDDFLKSISDIKGGMTLVDSDFIESVLDRLSSEPDVVPGGAACNTIIGISKLGGDGGFVGQCGRDDYGAVFEKDLMQNGVAPNLFKSSTATGRVLSIITPDAQRSMFTYLGASAEMVPDQVTVSCFTDAAIVLIEGYLLFNPALMMSALNAAKSSGALIAMDLASFTVVEESLDFLKEQVIPFVDILIANEDEAAAFTGHSEEMSALHVLSQYADLAVLKVGAKGSYVAWEDQVLHSPAVTGEQAVVDTTGAGDLWASGFLFGLVSGFTMEMCGKLASACGYEVCKVIGASIPQEGWDRIYSSYIQV